MHFFAWRFAQKGRGDQSLQLCQFQSTFFAGTNPSNLCPRKFLHNGMQELWEAFGGSRLLVWGPRRSRHLQEGVCSDPRSSTRPGPINTQNPRFEKQRILGIATLPTTNNPNLKRQHFESVSPRSKALTCPHMQGRSWAPEFTALGLWAVFGFSTH